MMRRICQERRGRGKIKKYAFGLPHTPLSQRMLVRHQKQAVLGTGCQHSSVKYMLLIFYCILTHITGSI